MNSSDCYHTVANKTVMHAGRHYAQFTVVKVCNSGPLDLRRDPAGLGRGRRAARVDFQVDGHCFYYTYTGRHFPPSTSPREWEGSQNAQKEGDCIGLLLDLDQGAMTVYKNDKQLGVMATGLAVSTAGRQRCASRATARASRLPRCQLLAREKS